MKLTPILALAFLVTPTLAGSADAMIRGKTQSGRTEVRVEIGDIEGSIRSVNLTIDGKSYTLSGEGEGKQSVIRDRGNGLYVLILHAEGKVFRLWMIPGSEKVTNQSPGVYRSRFGAVIEATDPRKEYGSMTPRITIGCTLDWEI